MAQGSGKRDEVRIPRALLQGQKPIRETKLHVFCDASQDDYGACAYLRRVFTDDKVECSLIAGKGRVAPLKSQSVCRLELMGALVAVRLTETLIEEMVTKIEKITFWSDRTKKSYSLCDAFRKHVFWEHLLRTS